MRQPEAKPRSAEEAASVCPGGGGGGVWQDALLCCCLQRAVPIGLLALTLALPLNPFLRRRRCPLASHFLVPSLSLPSLSLPPPPYTPFLPLGRSCQRSPQTFPASLLCAGSARRRATLARCVHVDTSITAVGDPSPTGAVRTQDVQLRGHFPARGGGGRSMCAGWYFRVPGGATPRAWTRTTPRTVGRRPPGGAGGGGRGSWRPRTRRVAPRRVPGVRTGLGVET